MRPSKGSEPEGGAYDGDNAELEGEEAASDSKATIRSMVPPRECSD